MELHELALRFIAPKVLHEGIDYRTIHGRNISIDNHRRMLAEDRGFRNHDLGICLGVTVLHHEPIQFVSYQRVAITKFKGRARLAR